MTNSFCTQIVSGVGASAKYWRGPSNEGFSVRSKARAAADWLAGGPKGDTLMLAGYSRGASAAIYAAEFLQDQGLKVDSLFLFDAVARHIFPGGEVIPANVGFSRHACRTDDATFVGRYEGSINSGMGNPARPWFGHTGLSYVGSGDHAACEFIGSHGALGGVGWKQVAEDPKCQAAVAIWMNKILAQRGLSVVLEARDPT
jgi:hypothetical protein